MAGDVAVMEDKTSNACCDALKKKHLKLLEKYSKLEELKNKFRNCTTLVQEKYDAIERENGALKKALEELKLQANTWKDEKEIESGRRVDLEDEVSALKEEIQLLKQNHNSAPQDAAKEIQEHLNAAKNEINHLKELLEKERERASSEKKKAELEKKKADEAFKKVEAGKKKASEAQKAATVERKRAEENKAFLEKLRLETDTLKSTLASEKSEIEATEKKVEAEKQKAATEKKRADLAEIKLEEQRKLAETNLKKAIFEKDRADNLNQKLDEARIRAEKLEELNKKLCSEKAVKGQDDKSKTGENADKSGDAYVDLPKRGAQLPKSIEKLLSDKDRDINRLRKHADSEKKKAKKHKKDAEVQKKLAVEQKHRADQLSKELESCRLMFKELQKELKEFVSQRTYADHARLGTNKDTTESDSVKLLKKRLRLEKMLVKHANETAKVEALRNSMLHRELFHLKQECLLFQHRLDFLDKSCLRGLEGTLSLEKIGNRSSTKETICSDGYQRPLVSGIESGLDPPYRGSNQKMLQSSAINSSSASFSDRTLGSQDRCASPFTASDKLGEDASNLKPTLSRLSDQRGIENYDFELGVAEVDNSTQSPMKDNDNKKRVVYSRKKRALESIENSYSTGEQLHQSVLEKLSLLDGILNDQKNEHEDILKENSSRNPVRPRKRIKNSKEGMEDIHHLDDSEKQKSFVDLSVDRSDACMHASAPRVDVLRISRHFKDGEDDKFRRNQCLPQDFDEMAACDYMKLLDLEDTDNESSYRRAIAMPLSPLPPEVDFIGGEELEGDNPEMLTFKGCPEAPPNVKESAASISSICIINAEKNPTSLDSLQLQPRGYSDDVLKSKGASLGSDNLLGQIHVMDGKLGMSNKSGSGDKEHNLQCESGLVPPHDCLPRYFIVSLEHKDNSSILRILQTMKRCIPRCSLYHSTRMFLQTIQHALLKAEDLSMKEKVCVLFSLLLHGISEVGITDFLNDELFQAFYSVALNITSALSDPVLRGVFVEKCDLLELFSVIEKFILQREVFVCGDVSSNLEATTSFKANLILSGNSIVVSEVIASAPLLVAGASLLASLCSAVGYIGFVCEASCNIITMHKYDRPVMLAVLHAFAYVCSFKYFALQPYSVAMTVVKSLVMFLHKQDMSADSNSFGPSMVENRCKFWVCSNDCPFSEGALSMEDAVSLLLEKLWKHGQKRLPQGLPVPRVCSQDDDRTIEISSLREDVLPNLTSDENFRNFTDFLSLLESLSSFMSWNWTFDHIICQLCEYLESHLMENFSTAAIVLLGQLGRVGVITSGYEDVRVMKLRVWLSKCTSDITFKKLDLSVQTAVISSLFGLALFKFEDLIQGKVETPTAMSQSIPPNFIRDWFFRLSCEQQSALMLHQVENDLQS